MMTNGVSQSDLVEYKTDSISKENFNALMETSYHFEDEWQN